MRPPPESAEPSGDFVIRPEVIAAMVYVVLVRMWSMWMFCTLRFPPRGSGEPFRVVTTAQYASLTAINVCFCAAFVMGAIESRKSHPNVRRGHYAGLVLGFAVVVLLQISAVKAHGPIVVVW